MSEGFRVTGAPIAETTMFHDHKGVVGSAVQVISEEYSPSVRRYIVRRKTAHSSPGVPFLGPKIGNMLSLFDLVLITFSILLFIPSLTNDRNSARTSTSLTDPSTANTVIVPTAAFNAGGVAASGASPLSGLTASVDVMTGKIALEATNIIINGDLSPMESLSKLFSKTIPWFVLTQVESVISLILTMFPKRMGLSPQFNTAMETGWLVQSVSTAVFWTFMIAIIMAIKIPVRMSQIAEEEIFMIQGVGVQITRRNFLGSTVSQRFIDVSLIKSIFIHEAFFRHRVIFFLAILVENKSDLEVLFQESLPRIAVLRPMLCGIRAVLYPNKREFGPSLADITSGKAAYPTSNSNIHSGMSSISAPLSPLGRKPEEGGFE